MGHPARQIRNHAPEQKAGARKEIGKFVVGLVGVLLMLAAFGWLFPSAPSNPPNPQTACLSKWDGGMFDFEWEVRRSLRDPDSFEHIETGAGPIFQDGTQKLLMKFRAKNGFGGMNIEMAQATVKHDGCKLLSWKML